MKEKKSLKGMENTICKMEKDFDKQEELIAVQKEAIIDLKKITAVQEKMLANDKEIIAIQEKQNTLLEELVVNKDRIIAIQEKQIAMLKTIVKLHWPGCCSPSSGSRPMPRSWSPPWCWARPPAASPPTGSEAG